MMHGKKGKTYFKILVNFLKEFQILKYFVYLPMHFKVVLIFKPAVFIL